MMLKRSTTASKPSAAARLARAGLASLAAAGAVAALATGCLDRPVIPQEPKTSNVYVDQIQQTAVDKIDLLFMIDNSVSMQDKQEILKAAVPVLVTRLVRPICVDPMGKPTVPAENSMNGRCNTKDAKPEFSPIGDIHIGIVSSSLGAHGGSVCATSTGPTDTLNDKAHLIASDVRTGIASWNSSGFLAWDQSGKANMPAGESDPAKLNTQFQNMIAAVGEHGCGYEASLESWYRFLVDPEPPADVVQFNGQTYRGVLSADMKSVAATALVLDKDNKPVIDPATGLAKCNNCDETLRAQRKAFLRPDSLVAIVMLSDENDCSIRDESVGWFVGSNNRMPRSTAVCATNPNDHCCRSCAQKEDSGPPAGCTALASDDVCKNNGGAQYATWDQLHDSLNLRCYNQHQRFGFDLLYDTNRYVEALRNPNIRLQSTGVVVTNPLYDNTGSDKAPRDPSLVFLAGIVGVPWQDIADEASLASPTALTYLTSKELVDKGRWPVLLGDPHPADGSKPVLPTDPFMWETTDVRTGTNPIANVPISPATSTNPHANVINGHEQNIPDLADLQYACTFPLQKPKDCMPGDAACDCSPDKAGKSDAVVLANSPLCQGGANINQQTSAKAYPGVRELQVLKDLGGNAIVASICPKVSTVAAGVDPSTDPNYGYNPAVGAIIERLKDALKGKCLPRPIDKVVVDENDPTKNTQVACKGIEAQQNGCNCQLEGRQDLDPQLKAPVLKQLQDARQCGTGTQAPCTDWCMCEIKQEKDAELISCQKGGGAPAGFCYVDEDPEQLKQCPENQQQLLRFIDGQNGVKTPVQGAVAIIACLGAPVGA
ncbi:MAG TPA: hypothetical protein VGC79_06400, partial [Polyangiaceae bacterium]